MLIRSVLSVRACACLHRAQLAVQLGELERAATIRIKGIKERFGCGRVNLRHQLTHRLCKLSSIDKARVVRIPVGQGNTSVGGGVKALRQTRASHLQSMARTDTSCTHARGRARANEVECTWTPFVHVIARAHQDRIKSMVRCRFVASALRSLPINEEAPPCASSLCWRGAGMR